jgi:hypothetical protein
MSPTNPVGNFESIPIEKAPAEAKYNANRFRIYFSESTDVEHSYYEPGTLKKWSETKALFSGKIPLFDAHGGTQSKKDSVKYEMAEWFEMQEGRTHLFAGNLKRYFPEIFNGPKKTTGDSKPSDLLKNVATVEWNESKKFNEKATLRFQLDMRMRQGKTNLPDIHSDWVGVVWDDPRGFAVQTLRRKFTEMGDKALYYALQGIQFGASGCSSEATEQTSGPVWDFVTQVNQNHVLAGRRSWVFGISGWESRQDPYVKRTSCLTGKSEYVPEARRTRFIMTPIFFLETAAIERYSHRMFIAAQWIDESPIGGWFITAMREAIEKVWRVLLVNFVRRFDLIVHEQEVKPGWATDAAYPGVQYIEGSFSDKSQCLQQPWVQELMKLHPGVAEQFSKVDQGTVAPLNKQPYP